MMKFEFNGRTYIHMHPTKCGGTSIREWCKKNIEGATDFVFKRHISYSSEYNDAITFSVFRNPYDRAISLYNYSIQSGFVKKDITFTRFVKDNFDRVLFDEKLKNEYKPFELQMNYHGPSTIVFDFNNLNNEWALFAKQHFKCDVPLHHAKQSFEDAVKKIPPTTKAFIEENWKEDFDYENRFITKRLL